MLLSLKDTFSRYRPSVAEHMYEVGVTKFVLDFLFLLNYHMEEFILNSVFNFTCSLKNFEKQKNSCLGCKT